MRREMIPLCLTAFFAYIAYMIAVPIIPIYAKELGASLLEVGIIYSSFFLTYMIFTAVWGSLSDTLLRRRPFLIFGLTGSGCVLIAFYFSTKIYQLIGFSLVRGIVIGAITPILLAMGSFYTGNEEKRGRGMGVINGSFSAGWFIGALASGFLTEVFLTIPFLVGALMTFTAASIVLFIVPEVRQPHVAQSNTNIEHATRKDVIEDLKRRVTLIFKKDDFVRERGLSTVYLTLILRHGGLLGLYSLFPLFVLQVGGTPSQVGFLYAINMGSQAVFMWTLGRVSDKIGRKPIMLMGLTGSAVVCIWFGLSNSVIALVPGQLLIGFSYAAVMVSATTIVADVAPTADRGEAMGLIMTSLGIGATIGPIIAGFIAETYGLSTMMFIMAILPLTALLVFSMKMKETVNFPQSSPVIVN